MQFHYRQLISYMSCCYGGRGEYDNRVTSDEGKYCCKHPTVLNTSENCESQEPLHAKCTSSIVHAGIGIKDNHRTLVQTNKIKRSNTNENMSCDMNMSCDIHVVWNISNSAKISYNTS